MFRVIKQLESLYYSNSLFNPVSFKFQIFTEFKMVIMIYNSKELNNIYF